MGAKCGRTPQERIEPEQSDQEKTETVKDAKSLSLVAKISKE